MTVFEKVIEWIGISNIIKDIPDRGSTITRFYNPYEDYLDIVERHDFSANYRSTNIVTFNPDEATAIKDAIEQARKRITTTKLSCFMETKTR